MFDPFEKLRDPIPDYLQELLRIEKKASLEIYCRGIEVLSHDFSLVIFNSNQIGYQHEINHHEFRPQHLEPTDKEVASLRKLSLA